MATRQASTRKRVSKSRSPAESPEEQRLRTSTGVFEADTVDVAACDGEVARGATPAEGVRPAVMEDPARAVQESVPPPLLGASETDVVGTTVFTPSDLFVKILKASYPGKSLVELRLPDHDAEERQFGRTVCAYMPPITSPFPCFQCHMRFDGVPHFIPMMVSAGVMTETGNYCSAGCAHTYIVENYDAHVARTRVALLYTYEQDNYGFQGGALPRSPPFWMRECYGGALSDAEFLRATQPRSGFMGAAQRTAPYRPSDAVVEWTLSSDAAFALCVTPPSADFIVAMARRYMGMDPYEEPSAYAETLRLDPVVGAATRPEQEDARSLLARVSAVLVPCASETDGLPSGCVRSSSADDAPQPGSAVSLMSLKVLRTQDRISTVDDGRGGSTNTGTSTYAVGGVSKPAHPAAVSVVGCTLEKQCRRRDMKPATAAEVEERLRAHPPLPPVPGPSLYQQYFERNQTTATTTTTTTTATGDCRTSPSNMVDE